MLRGGGAPTSVHDQRRAHRARVTSPCVSRILALLSVVLCSGLLAACSAGEQAQVERTLERAARATKGLGMQMTTTGTLSVAGQRQALRSRATIEPDGRRARIRSAIAGHELEQYVDGSAMLMSVDGFPIKGPWPSGTRYLRFDLDRLGRAAGIDTTLRDLQSLDPAKTAALLGKAADDVSSAGRGTIGGVPVQRYRARVRLDKLVASLTGGGQAGAAGMLEDSTMTVEVAIDGDDRIRGVALDGAIGPATITTRAQITAFDRDIRVAVPSAGVYDVTDAVARLAGALSGP